MYRWNPPVVHKRVLHANQLRRRLIVQKLFEPYCVILSINDVKKAYFHCRQFKWNCKRKRIHSSLSYQTPLQIEITTIANQMAA
ncbi:hypothetical protein EVE91_15550 (plasmid) [Lactiplantibacillus plantarum]|nr:hypothetical protein EVE91_15550 [Lactiplantibacillus plantarum]